MKNKNKEWNRLERLEEHFGLSERQIEYYLKNGNPIPNIYEDKIK